MENNDKSKEPTNLEKLEEMDNQLDQAIGNCNKIIDQQNRLINLIEASKEKDFFASFVKELKFGIENYKKQIQDLQRKRDLIKEINEMAKSDESGRLLVLDKIIELFRIFR